MRDPRELAGVRAAAGHARCAVPGALGALAARELLAYADLGHRGTANDLVPQLARQVLALPALPAAASLPAGVPPP